uniref:DUF4377 domain-containing protein n=1 Tax=Panagrellus redivivus TaxID=6233 RepID=A0A7E4VM38_PANRE
MLKQVIVGAMVLVGMVNAIKPIEIPLPRHFVAELEFDGLGQGVKITGQPKNNNITIKLSEGNPSNYLLVESRPTSDGRDRTVSSAYYLNNVRNNNTLLQFDSIPNFNPDLLTITIGFADEYLQIEVNNDRCPDQNCEKDVTIDEDTYRKLNSIEITGFYVLDSANITRVSLSEY